MNMLEPVKKICVIGAGMMGRSIAALIASSKHEVVLLDLANPSPNHNKIAKEALEEMLKPSSQAFTHKAHSKYITIGNLTDDLQLISDCSLVIEAVVENIAIKHKLFQQITPYLNKNAIIASNTSTLSLESLKTNLSNDLKKRCIILHFFNPPRFMELLELVIDHETDQQVISTAKSFVTDILGKTVIECNDTPGFIANRLGCFLLELVVRKTINEKLDPVIIDKIFSDLFKLPKTGIFGLYDLIGHDVMQLISNSLLSTLPANDLYHKIYKDTEILNTMINNGLLGRKSKAGFYRINQNKQKEVIDFQTLSYKTANEETLPYNTILALLEAKDTYSIFFKEILQIFYLYLSNVVTVITNNVENIDIAMQLGYNWKIGPFKLLSHYIGFDNIKVSTKLQSMLSLYKYNNSILNKAKTIKYNNYAQIFEYNNRVIFTIKSKLNTLNTEVFNLLLNAIDYAESKNINLYLYPSNNNFSAGADLKFIDSLIKSNNTKEISAFITLGQKVMMRLKYSSAKIISCASGVALGGGCELLLHSDLIIMHRDLNAGLVEISANLVPGWGGITQMFLRSHNDPHKLIKSLRNILEFNKTSSAEYLIEYYAINDYIIIPNSKLLQSYILDDSVTNQLMKKNHNQSVNYDNLDLLAKFDTSSYNNLQNYVLSQLQTIINNKEMTEKQLLEFEHDLFINIIPFRKANI